MSIFASQAVLRQQFAANQLLGMVKASLAEITNRKVTSYNTLRRIQRERKRVVEPTAAQAEAGNYRKGHIRIHGLDITIENPKGSTRSGVDNNGKAWSTEMKHDYGYIRKMRS